jgi:SAM-dependent methyltransferase
MEYAKLKKELDSLNFDKSHFVNSNDICTPMNCVEDMVDAIPEELWKRENIKVLDPCCGNGNFPAYLKEKINNTGKLFLNEINEKRIKNIEKFFSNITLTKKDFFDFKDDEEYDLVIANPPYAKFDMNGFRTAKNHNLSREFVKKALLVLKKDGYLVFIIPDNWMSLSDRNDVVELLSKYQFIYLNIHGAKKYFPSVGSSFTWFVVQKKENSQKFIIDNFYKKKEKSLTSIDNNIRSIPLFYNDKVKSIINKTLFADNKKVKIETTSDLHKYTKKKNLSKDKTDKFKYPIWHTQNQKIYSDRPHKFQDGWKVYISLTSYYSTFIDNNTGMTQSIGFVRCDSEKEAKSIKEMLDHPLYTFLNNIHRYGNFNNNRILQLFPLCLEKDVFNCFNISEKEKEFILDFLKKT